ncbi:MAG: formylglycine-generating enzyme family protein [Kiritimatiellae bacterium]|nr:formylglycine-generating enzyme family protein [Kiritimatiellia bacterium]
MKTKAMIFGAAAIASSMLMAADTPEVENVVMTQASFGRMVTVTYKLKNAADGAVVTFDVETNTLADASGEWVSIGGAAVCNARGAVWRKVTAADADSEGKYTITWRPDLSWEGHKVSLADGGARAVVTAWALDNTPDYMVVDISAAAKPNTQRYYPAVDFLPGGLLGNPDYRTTSLVMRKILAKDVTWTMGSVAENGRNADREATHRVTLTCNYYIGVYEVTQTQWQQITGYNPSNFTTDRTMRPVEKVSYRDIRQGKGTATSVASATSGVYPADPYGDSFLGLLRSKTGIDFDLPSEAQWEFAARAGNGEGYWGEGSDMQISSGKDMNLDLLGRYLKNPVTNATSSPDSAIAPANGGTAIVGSYAPNAWGLYDMNGNVWEWCLDWFANDIKALNGTVNTASGASRILRGGGWSHEAGSCRAATRNGYSPATRQGNFGFRVACTAGLQ